MAFVADRQVCKFLSPLIEIESPASAPNQLLQISDSQSTRHAILRKKRGRRRSMKKHEWNKTRKTENRFTIFVKVLLRTRKLIMNRLWMYIKWVLRMNVSSCLDEICNLINVHSNWLRKNQTNRNTKVCRSYNTLAEISIKVLWWQLCGNRELFNLCSISWQMTKRAAQSAKQMNFK